MYVRRMRSPVTAMMKKPEESGFPAIIERVVR
jgi:hypothetical protein